VRRSLATLSFLGALLGACGASSPAGTLPPTQAISPSTWVASGLPTFRPVASSSAKPVGLAPTGITEEAKVIRVIDGDTIVVDRGQDDERLRYIGMDTPETVKPGSSLEWIGREASEANHALVDGKTVVLERDVSETDRFGRLLRHVWLRQGLGWSLVDLELVRGGYARVSTYPPDVKYADLYLAAQVDAREHDRGLWGDGPLNFRSPEDGAIVATKTIVVRGTTTPDSRIVRDISVGLDQSARVAADGTRSMEVKLKSGINSLHFRVEDQKDTTRTLQVTYSP
jgi:endonuclease YncB( thermonuclease family)